MDDDREGAPWPRKGNALLTYQTTLDFSSPSSSAVVRFAVSCPASISERVALVPCPQLSATDLTHASHRSCLTLTALSDDACTSTPSKFGPPGSASNARRRNVVVVSRVVFFSLYFWYKGACRVAVVSCRELVAMAVTNWSRLWQLSAG